MSEKMLESVKNVGCTETAHLNLKEKSSMKGIASTMETSGMGTLTLAHLRLNKKTLNAEDNMKNHSLNHRHPSNPHSNFPLLISPR